MKCRKCDGKAVANLRAYRIALCANCYIEFYKKLVNRSISRHGIFRKDDRILLAVSGGKDSSAMASVLREIGYSFEMLHIDLGIGEYSVESRKKVEELAKLLSVKLNVVELKEYGFTISSVKGRVCSACGIAKRYIMNRFARENGFTVVATGHTAEDLASFYLKNLAGNQMFFAEKLLPRIEPFDRKIVARARPLFEISEKENMLYAILKGLPFKSEECPYAPKQEWKEIVYDIELKKPGFVKNFIRGFAIKVEMPRETRYCSVCGEVSSDEICSFCKIRIRFSKFKESKDF
ncbi:MAG: adenine nucleotide alpha hydrolase family protein [Archaeoglobaceae archaeon]|nr:adenine nucleotide alpha hydrolase family protein [Archaeoglobaceae archaeon]